MEFKNFRVQVIARSVIFALVLAAFVYAINQPKWYVTSGALLLISVLLIAELIRYVEKTRREIANFLTSINLNDYSSTANLNKYKKSKNKDLNQAFEFILRNFQDVRIEKELHYQYLQTVMGHIETALICFDADGKIALINKAAQDLLDTRSTQSISWLKRKTPEIGLVLENIQSSEQKVVKIKLQGELRQLSIRATAFKIRDKYYKLTALQDIKNELESQELESWQRLIRVLTHEIMNSVTPVSSLSQAVKSNLEKNPGEITALSEMDQQDLNDIYESIAIIEKRSHGLLKFVETYKSLTRLPQPNFEKVYLDDFLKHIHLLLKSEMEKNNIRFSIENQAKDAILYLDHEMMVRVMINLIANAQDAFEKEDNPQIIITAFTDSQNRVNISVSDNGKGMDHETLENMFVPFFTTKEKGSGIGLSLCRQIMHLHKGNIIAESEPGQGSNIILKF